MHKRKNAGTSISGEVKSSRKNVKAPCLEKITWELSAVIASTLLLDQLKPRNPPDDLWREDEAASAPPLHPLSLLKAAEQQQGCMDPLVKLTLAVSPAPRTAPGTHRAPAEPGLTLPSLIPPPHHLLPSLSC